MIITPNADSGKLSLASQLGTAQNVVLSTGLTASSGAATDDGPALTAFAQLGGVKLVLDGASASSGLFLASAGDVEVEGMGDCSGLYQTSGSNNVAIQNSAPNAKTNPYDVGVTTIPARVGRVALKNFYLNANGTGVSSSGDPHTTPGFGPGWAMAIHMQNLNDLVMRDLTVFHSPTYAVILRNIGRTLVDGCKFLRASGDTPFNTDALHFDGSFDHATVTNCHFENIGDDSIAFNLPEGNAGSALSALVYGNTFVNVRSLVRAYTTTGITLNSLKIAHNIGSVTWVGIDLGLWDISPSPGDANAFDSVTIEDNDITGGQRFAVLSTNTRSQQFSDNVWQLNSTPSEVIGVYYGCTIAELRIDGMSVVDTGSYGPVSYLLNIQNNCYISRLVIDAVDPTNITNLTNDFTRIGTISGAGVLATGWQIPDANMAKWTPYISATSGLPSYKNASDTVVTL